MRTDEYEGLDNYISEVAHDIWIDFYQNENTCEQDYFDEADMDGASQP